MRLIRRFAHALAVVGSAGFLAAPAAASTGTYPDKPIHLLVAFSTGGVLDTLARTMASELSARYGQSIVVENRTGASGNIGTDLLARAKPDGYTIGMGTIATHGINPALYGERLPYDPVKGFTPLALLAEQTNIVLVNNDLPVTSIPTLIEYLRANPGKVAYGSAGNGSSQHLSGQLFKLAAGVELLHVPYRGSVPALTDLVSGQVQLMFVDVPAALPFIKSGKVRPIAVTAAHRSSAFPDLPTVAEQGLEGFNVRAWFGVLAPADTPAPIAEKLSADMIAAVQQPAIRERLEALGMDIKTLDGPAFGQFIQDEIARWDEIVKRSGTRLE